MLWVPGCFIYKVFKVKKDSESETSFISRLFGPNEKWGPYLDKHRAGTKYARDVAMGGVTNKSFN